MKRYVEIKRIDIINYLRYRGLTVPQPEEVEIYLHDQFYKDDEILAVADPDDALVVVFND